MCLKVFCRGDKGLYQKLEEPARRLGSAFQKVNFLRDLKNDMNQLNRRYFPEIQDHNLNEESKMVIVRDIENDFSAAYPAIGKLPGRSKLAVYTAYSYYRVLLKKISCTPASEILENRIRIPGLRKYFLLIKAFLWYTLRLI
jgi:phytoene/squalene synthetase